MSALTTADIIDRLGVLWRKLEDEGQYVSANTVYLALVRLAELTPQPDIGDRQCADCGYPLGDKPVFLGGVWFCATCNPAIP